MYVTGLGGATAGQANAALLQKHTVSPPNTLLSSNKHTQKTVAWTPGQGPEGRDKHAHAGAAMVKCLIRITTRVNVHLRMINHCYRDVKVRVLSLGPRMLGKALGVLPLYPALMGQQESASPTPLPDTPLPCVQPSSSAGKQRERGESLTWRCMEVQADCSGLNREPVSCRLISSGFWRCLCPNG